MELRILGSDGGASLHHRNVSLLVDGRLALDAGSLACGLDLEEQGRVAVVLLTHAHMDHVADLGAITDVRAQQGGPTLPIRGLPETVAALEAHFFNDVLWPDFRRIPAGDGPTIELLPLAVREPFDAAGFRVTAIPVDHAVPACGFLVDDGRDALGYTGDTGPTEEIWDLLRETRNLRAVVTEVSYPDREAELARISGHLTPATFARQLERLSGGTEPRVLVYGLKPVHAAEIVAELERLELPRVEVLAAGRRFTW